MRRSAWYAVPLLVATVGLWAESAGPAEPHPGLKPEQVVRLQLEALQRNDTPTKDAGIRRAFAFASPSNRAATGPVERFIQLVRNPLYAPLLDHKRHTLEPIELDGDHALQVAALVAADGQRVTYVFQLSRQAADPCKGCWMTDGVLRRDAKATQIARR